MNLTDLIPGADLVKVGMSIIEKVIPDPNAKAAAQLELLKAQQAGELAKIQIDVDLAKGQMAINAEEAKSSSLFVSGWRPCIGWICGFGLGFQFIVAPMATWGTQLAGKVVQFPPLDTSTLLTLLFGMLGLGAYRTAEKIKGVAAK